MDVDGLLRRTLRRWPPYATRQARVRKLRRMNARTRRKVAAAHQAVLEAERPIGEDPSLLDLEWFEHRTAPRPRRDDPDLARSCGLEVGPGPADLQVLVFYGEVAALLEPRHGARPKVVLVGQDGAMTTTATGPIDRLPTDVSSFLAGVAALSVARREAILRVEVARTDHGLAYVGIAPDVPPVRLLNPTIDRNLGRRAEKAYARLRHDLAARGAP